jgi:chromosomal replication initiator protein
LSAVWSDCQRILRNQLSDQDFNAWIRPLHATEIEQRLELYAPNAFVEEHIHEHFLALIHEIVTSVTTTDYQLYLQVDSTPRSSSSRPKGSSPTPQPIHFENNLHPFFTFENFVEGKSTQLAHAASLQVADNPGSGYNPLFIHGSTGLGKTHLMQAIGNHLLKHNPSSRVLYIRSQNFVNDMVSALRHNKIDQFKKYFHSLDVLLIDDIQFFAGKSSSQEEFFNTYNSLLEGSKQIVLTSDQFPKDINNLEDRLKSRFGAGLTVAVEPPELETRVAILMKKAQQLELNLSQEVAFEIAKFVKSNVRELEGALNNIHANYKLTGNPITMESSRLALRDLIAVHERLISIDNIQKVISDYYNVSLSDLLSKSRSRSIARPRQIAMTLAKELTEKSLPEIGRAFGGRDHTTVIHACKKIKELVESDSKISKDYKNLQRQLST